MKFYFDENFPSQIGRALNILQNPRREEDVEVYNISEVFGRGVQDESWIPEIGKENGIVITQDFKIQQTKHQKELYERNKVGMIFLKSPSNKGFSYWELVERIIISWSEIKKTSQKAKRPFSFIIRPRSKRLEEI